MTYSGNMDFDFTFSRFEVDIRFIADAYLPLWKGNTLRSAFGLALREITCNRREDCGECLLRKKCHYSYLFDTSPPEDAPVLRKQGDIARPFILEAPNLRKREFKRGERTKFYFTLFGRGIEYFPYFLVAIREMGERGLGKGYKKGSGRFVIEGVNAVDEINGKKITIYEDDTVLNRSLEMMYQDILSGSEEWDGELKLIFTTPTQIKKDGRFITDPDFRTLISRLLFRVNMIGTFHCGKMLYDEEGVREILEVCEGVELKRRNVNVMDYMERYSRVQGKKIKIPTFFVGELVYDGSFSRDLMALIELGRFTHVGKLATFGCGKYEVERDWK